MAHFEEKVKDDCTAAASQASVLSRIKEEIAQGYNTLAGISRSTGYSRSYISRIIHKNKLLPRKRERTISKIKAAFEKGLTLQQAARELKTSPLSLRETVRNYDLSDFLSEQLPPTRENLRLLRHREDKENSTFYKLVRRGLSPTQLGERFGFTREWARQHINDSGMHSYWRKSREQYKQHTEKKELQHNRLSIYQCIREHLHAQLRSLPEEHWPEKMAARYILQHVRQEDAIPAQKLVNVYAAYQKAQKAGKALSFEEMGRRRRISGSQVRLLLEAVGCSSLNWTCDYRPRLTAQQQEAIRKARTFEMNDTDLAYFSGRSVFPFRAYAGKRGSYRPHFYAAYFGPSQPRLTYRLASQMYEARDLGFQEQEIQELFDVPQQIVTYALHERKNIGQKIIKALRHFHPEKKITRPYLSSHIRL